MYIGVCSNGFRGYKKLISGLLRGLLRGGYLIFNQVSGGLAMYTYVHKYIYEATNGFSV